MFVAIILSIRALTFFSTLTVGIVLRSIQRHYDVSAALKKKKNVLLRFWGSRRVTFIKLSSEYKSHG